MIKFYFAAAPNPFKVALYLEETGLEYEFCPIDTRKGDQHQPAFLAINPNAKTPVITDDGVRVFDSNAILLTWPRRPASSCPPTRRPRVRKCIPG